MSRIRVAIAGVGNCASALVQGVAYYAPFAPPKGPDGSGAAAEEAPPAGLMHPEVGGFRPHDLEFGAAFGVDARKVGRPLEEAVFAKPNCALVFQPTLPASGVIVQPGPVLDGVAEHMSAHPEDRAFRVAADAADAPVDVEEVLRRSGAEVLVVYLPVGSEAAVAHYAEACLAAGVAFVNCVPVFVASDPGWAERFRRAGLPIVGDDIKSQVGATIVHRNLARLFEDRGVDIEHTYQLNFGGNTDFLNMLERERLMSKKISKTSAVASQLDYELPEADIHVGPSDYVPWLLDRKFCHIRMEGRTFGDVPLNLELKLEVWDSPNSAGVVIDAIRCCKLALNNGLKGQLDAPSAYFMKSPPVQYTDDEAHRMVEEFIAANAKPAGEIKKTARRRAGK